jgi:hypothetical protein
MLLLKSVLCVGVALSVLLYGWAEYLEPARSKVWVDPSPVRTTEVFRPTPAPPITDLETLSPAKEAATDENEKLANAATPVEAAKLRRAKVRKQKVYVARRATAPRDSFAYFRTQPFFFGWR